MRICLVSETWAPEINGVAHTLGHISRELHRRGDRLQLIRPRAKDGSTCEIMEEELQVKGFRLPRYSDVQLGLPAWRAIARLWQTRRPDVVYIATEGPLGYSALNVARRLDIPVVSGFHTNFDHYAGDYGMRWLKTPVLAMLRRFHNRTQATLVPTAAQAETLRSQGFGNVHVMGRGIDSQHFTPDKRDPQLRRRWGVDEHQPVALYVGRLASEKNLDLLVDTLQAMREAQPDLVAVLVGDGPQRASLQQRLPDAIFTGFIDHDTLARHYASAELFVFPSLSETYGNVVVEAMASGLGVVAFDYAAANQWIDNERHGVTVACGDSQAFTAAAVELCQHPARYGRLGRAARARIQSQRWEHIADTFLAILASVQEPLDDASHPCRL
ncbi:glycosyl transferase [Litchfieldella qijiaojingensis]|uniref:Glycosyl transferase n=1 Tax=Litchfieldella qijiaojingensis TaxID=980347 RepID=A0ABQ2YC64_9GAMM|nr:glycosyltransferase family 1 protein [Halomonas qijiaojingensis]GGX79541.1 glycosyl transferase [Halomonas qijiaojingensis]